MESIESDSLQGVARAFASNDDIGRNVSLEEAYTLHSDIEDEVFLENSDSESLQRDNSSISREPSRINTTELNRESSAEVNAEHGTSRKSTMHFSREQSADLYRGNSGQSLGSEDNAEFAKHGTVEVDEDLDRQWTRNSMERGSTFGLTSMYASRNGEWEDDQHYPEESNTELKKINSSAVPELINEANTLHGEIEDIFKELDVDKSKDPKPIVLNTLVGTDDVSPVSSPFDAKTSMRNKNSHDASTSTFTPREVERKALIRLSSELDKLKEKLKCANQTDNTVVKKNSVAWEITDSLLKEEEIKKKIEEKQAELEREIARCRLSKGLTLRDYYTKWAEKRGKFGAVHDPTGPVCTCVPPENLHAHFDGQTQYEDPNTHYFRLPVDESTLPTVVPLMYAEDGSPIDTSIPCTCENPPPSSVYVHGTWNPRDGTIRISNQLNVTPNFCKIVDNSHTNDQDPVSSTPDGEPEEATDECNQKVDTDTKDEEKEPENAVDTEPIERVNVDTQCNLSSSRSDDDFYKSMKNAQYVDAMGHAIPYPGYTQWNNPYEEQLYTPYGHLFAHSEYHPYGGQYIGPHTANGYPHGAWYTPYGEPYPEERVYYRNVNQAQYSDFSPRKSEHAFLSKNFKSVNDFYEYERDQYYDTSGPCPANLKTIDVYGKGCKHYHYHTHYGGKKHNCKHKCKHKRHKCKHKCKHKKKVEALEKEVEGDDTLLDIAAPLDSKSDVSTKFGDTSPFCGFGFCGCTSGDIEEPDLESVIEPAKVPEGFTLENPILSEGDVPVEDGIASDALNSPYSTHTSNSSQTPMVNQHATALLKTLPVFNRNITRKRSSRSQSSSVGLRIPVYPIMQTLGGSPVYGYRGQGLTPTTMDASTHSGDFTFRGDLGANLALGRSQQGY